MNRVEIEALAKGISEVKPQLTQQRIKTEQPQ